MKTARIDARLAREFPGAAHAPAVALVERICVGLDTWRIVSETDRVEAAALEWAHGDLRRLDDAAALALVDWRDLLVRAGDA